MSIKDQIRAEIERRMNELEADWSGTPAAGWEFSEVLSFLDTLPEQKWNEEEKQKLNRIYEILGCAADDKGFLKSKRIIGDKEAIELQDFLKSLRPQPKQEWSEEDEHIRHQLIVFCEKCMQQDSEAKRCAAWLKSLRPSWKPSEEQIETLERWLLDNKFKGDSRYVYPIFDSLYNDLKKLM